VTGAARRFSFAGDTGYFAGFSQIARALGPFDLAALPIGAYEPAAMMRPAQLNPEEAAQAPLDLDARAAVAIHYGTFDLSDEPLDEPPRRFLAAAAQSALGESGAWVLRIGEVCEF
jgi:N-acyl-phosphatidylethanolamine-hydrolysing phospholipase D